MLFHVAQEQKDEFSLQERCFSLFFFLLNDCCNVGGMMWHVSEKYFAHQCCEAPWRPFLGLQLLFHDLELHILVSELLLTLLKSVMRCEGCCHSNYCQMYVLMLLSQQLVWNVTMWLSQQLVSSMLRSP